MISKIVAYVKENKYFFLISWNNENTFLCITCLDLCFVVLLSPWISVIAELKE